MDNNVTAESIQSEKKMQKIQKARAMRFKKSTLDSMSFENIISEIYDIAEICSDVQYTLDTVDEDAILESLDGDDEELFEFKMAFSDLSAMCDEFTDSLRGKESELFDDTLVALVGRRVNLVGYDSVQEDYYSLGEYEQELATTASGERLMRLTKKDMLAEIGRNMSLFIGYLDLRQRYDYLKATMDILNGEVRAMQQAMEQIELLYEEAAKENFSPYSRATKRFDEMAARLPERMWLE